MCVCVLYNINMNLNGYINKLFIKTLKFVILLPKRKKENLISEEPCMHMLGACTCMVLDA